MATKLKTEAFIKSCVAIALDILKLPLEHIWIDYDREADVLYLNFRKHKRATETIETDDDILIRKDDDKIVGITILNASSR
jgi:uncharacterized protein YuzE